MPECLNDGSSPVSSAESQHTLGMNADLLSLMTEGWLFYDGNCRILRFSAKIAQTLSIRRAIGLVDIRKLPSGLRKAFPLTAIHVYRKRRVLTGVMAILQIMMMIPVLSFVSMAIVRSVDAFSIADKTVYPFLKQLRVRHFRKTLKMAKKK